MIPDNYTMTCHCADCPNPTDERTGVLCQACTDSGCDTASEYCNISQPRIEDDDITLDHIPNVSECRKLCIQLCADDFWPNVWHVNERGNVDLLSVGYNGAKIVRSWV